jgi:putative PIN family toxin of toxin-antitoxin system
MRGSVNRTGNDDINESRGRLHTSLVRRIVIDTNVCLDLFLFRDPRTAQLHADLQTGTAVALTNAECREEWLRVLQYPQLRLDDAARVRLTEEFDALVQSHAPAPSVPAARLPRCADPDDQKFLQLALDCGARWLVSRDHALLALAKRTRRDGLFEIVPPEGWVPAAGEGPHRAAGQPAL